MRRDRGARPSPGRGGGLGVLAFLPQHVAVARHSGALVGRVEIHGGSCAGWDQEEKARHEGEHCTSSHTDSFVGRSDAPSITSARLRVVQVLTSVAPGETDDNTQTGSICQEKTGAAPGKTIETSTTRLTWASRRGHTFS